jgi:hypothetical protein
MMLMMSSSRGSKLFINTTILRSAVRSHRSIEVTGAAVQVGATNGIEDLSWMEPWRPVKTITTSSYPIDPWP